MAGGGAFEAVEDAGFIALGLEAAEEPGADIGEGLVVEVDGILGGDEQAESEGAGLLEEDHGGVRGGGEVAVDFVHVEHGAEAGGAALGSHPAEHLIEEEGDEEHALAVVEVSDAEDADAGLAGGGVEEAFDVEGFAGEPGAEAWGGEEVVDAHGEFRAFFFGEEGFEVDDADAAEGWGEDVVDDFFQVEVLAGAPGVAEDGREEDVFAAVDGVGGDADEAEDGAGGGFDAFGEEFGVVEDFEGGGGEGGEDGDGDAAVAAWGEDIDIDGLAEGADAIGGLAPVAEAFFPEGGLASGEGVGGLVFFGSVVLVDPGTEGVGGEVWEGEEEVGDIAFGVDDDGGDAVEGGFFEEGEAEAGFAAAGHAEDDAVGDEVFGVVEEELVLGGFGGDVVGAAEVEGAGFFVVGGGDGHGMGVLF